MIREYFFNGFWRMDWGFGNPNKTAALIAMLMIAVWSFAYFRKWGFWLAVTLFSGLGICLIHTYSRGGMIALLAGIIPLMVMASRPWPRYRIVGVVVSVWVIVGASIFLQANERFSKGLVHEDRSITNRVALWKYTPTMMVDAPGGWGMGNAGKAFMEWYQPLNRLETYRTLVSSHLTWLVEMGWPLRILYMLGWLSILLLCFPSRREPWLAVPFGIWVTFFVAALFSSVAELVWVWLLPGAALFAVLGWRLKRNAWPQPWKWIFPPALTGALAGVIVLAAQPSLVKKTATGVLYGDREPDVWVVVDTKVLGSSYGRTLREEIQKSGVNSVGIVTDSSGLPSQGLATVVFTGDSLKNIANTQLQGVSDAKELIFVNPSAFPSEIGALKEKAVVLIGEFSQSPAAYAWMELPGTRRFEGVGDFIPDWPNRLLKRGSNE